ncbi:hypothetical protein B0A55_12790, partial [Friedmanniomyces simplex]
MFSTGAVPGRVTDDTYGAEYEDYSKDATELDYWVFDKVKQLFKDAKTDAELDARLRESKVVFFLHLLGLDTTGHSYRPYSREYLHNIKIVDEGVKEITKLIDDFYGDEETAYVFTADHGMSDWGSHGDGHPDNTRTPLIAWGAGVAKPITFASGKAPGHEDGFSHDWHLDHVQRHDVAQADVATLMAYLAGLEFPVNSVGELPLSYLTASDDEKAKAMLVNAREILEMYHVKEEDKKSTVLRYKPYGSFAGANQTTDDRLAHVETAINNNQYQHAIDASDELIQLGLQGIRYLQTYDWLFLRTLVTAGYLGWIAFAFTTAVDAYMLDGKYNAERTVASIAAFASVLVAMYSFLFVQSSALTYYLYAFFPVMFWEEVFVRRKALLAGKNRLFAKFSQQDILKLALNFAAYIGILEVMVQSYYHRSIYTICYLIATAWPAFYGSDFLRENAFLCATWALGCASMSIFTLLPAIKVESATMILVGGLLILVLGVLYISLEKSLLVSAAPPGKDREGLKAAKADGISRGILGAQVGLIALAMLVTRSSVASLQAKQGLPLGTQMAGWFTLDSKMSLLSRVSTSQTYADTKPIRDEVQGYPVLIQIFILFFLALWALPLLLFAGIGYVFYTLPRRWLRRRSRMERGGLPPKDADYRRVSVAEAAMNPPVFGLLDECVASLVVPFLHALQPRDHYLHRLVVIFLAFGPMFIILTISYEGLFYLAIAITLVSWVRLEHRIHQRFSPASTPPSTHSPLDLTTPLAPALSAARDREQALTTGDYRSLTLSDARICLFFLFLLQSAFFSTGNIASISSFSLDAVYRLLPIFDPFSQGALLILKLLAPFAL